MSKSKSKGKKVKKLAVRKEVLKELTQDEIHQVNGGTVICPNSNAYGGYGYGVVPQDTTGSMCRGSG